MPPFLVAFRSGVQGPVARAAWGLALVSALAAAGCTPESRREEFLGSRVADTCDAQWPVCDKVVGCLLGDASYIQGKFPGDGRLAVQLFEPSVVRILFLLDGIIAAGDETVINFYEDQCRSRVRHTVTGRTFVGESEQVGYVAREADLAGVGDHLIEFTSDSRLTYAAKLEVIPDRLKDQQGQ